MSGETLLQKINSTGIAWKGVQLLLLFQILPTLRFISDDRYLTIEPALTASGDWYNLAVVTAPVRTQSEISTNE